MKYRILACVVCAIALGIPAVVGAQGDPGAAAALKERQARVARQRADVATKLSAADHALLREQEKRVQELIDRLEAGKQVSPREIDEALDLSR